MMGCL